MLRHHCILREVVSLQVYLLRAQLVYQFRLWPFRVELWEKLVCAVFVFPPYKSGLVRIFLPRGGGGAARSAAATTERAS
jgi:hypothetical protein